ncbi:glycosyltransferase family 4 protein [Prosthecomicrobium hirschii]|uniref:glycosyltransferase family 4 protein n=1 Tax=Prosthecodimorpha hirschii TaxID=665126 RepID=UPI00221F791F|nr:glycosyltransferase family 4 protein [Prosthecomicrobium hirschii]MCW1843759.1 glycosyltransferase family 4 protein [Prosthecomicrobium hirschii]
MTVSTTIPGTVGGVVAQAAVASSAVLPRIPDVGPAERRLRICVVYSRTPVPMRRADQMTVAHLLAFLDARGHEVDLFYVDTGAEAEPEDRAWLIRRTRRCFGFALNRLSVLAGLTRVVMQLLPFQVGLFTAPAQLKAVREAVKTNGYDILYTYYFRSAEITRDLGFPTGTPKAARAGRPASFLAFQLSQTLNTRRIAKNAPDLTHKLFYEVESRLVERYEARIWRHFTRSVLIGKTDVHEIREACRRQGVLEIDNFVYGAHGTDTSRFAPRPDIPVRPDHLVFSGVMRTPTNVQAAQWFVTNVWPLIRAERPQATFAIVGREPTGEVMELAKVAGVTVTGTVPDPALLIAEAAVCVNPMQAGGGMQNKLIEFMGSAKAIVATSVANEGIGAPSDCLVVADAPRDFARAVLDLLADPARAADLGRRAREHVLERWTWEAHFLTLELNFYEAIDG